MQIRRQKFLIDAKVQGALALRVAGYWIACLWGVFCVLAGFPVVVTWWFGFPNAPSSAELIYQTWVDFWPAIAASLLLLPFFVRDVICWSNRIVGPFFRIRTAMRDLARGKTIEPIGFRKDDFWSDIAADLNQIAALMAENNGTPAEADENRQPTLPETNNVDVQPEQELVAVID